MKKVQVISLSISCKTDEWHHSPRAGFTANSSLLLESLFCSIGVRIFEEIV